MKKYNDDYKIIITTMIMFIIGLLISLFVILKNNNIEYQRLNDRQVELEFQLNNVIVENNIKDDIINKKQLVIDNLKDQIDFEIGIINFRNEQINDIKKIISE